MEFAGPDPLANRVTPLPGRATAKRIRMTAPLTVADAVGFVGMLFGAGADPCRLNREDIAGYATGRDEQALALALDFERHCRP